MSKFNTPILFLVFNRPAETLSVFEEIRKCKPSRLFVASDGPRSAQETNIVSKVREIATTVDWDCEVVTLFREQNLGCREAISSAITWFFDHVDQGIILEDDCLPNQDFFRYCGELLDRYKFDSRVMQISGEHKIRHRVGDATYYFAKIRYCWGWATWARSWKLYDSQMSTFPLFREQSQIRNVFDEEAAQSFWMNRFEQVFNSEVDTWCFVWAYSVLSNGGLCINSNYNMVSNIGFNANGTRCTDNRDPFAGRPLEEIGEIVHPEFVMPDRIACSADHKEVFQVFKSHQAKDTYRHSSFKRLRRSIKKKIFGGTRSK